MLATTIVRTTLVHILAGFAVTLQLVARRTAAVETTHGVAARAFTAPIGIGTLIYI